MPIFEYRCTECGKNFEELVVSSSQKVVCPACGKEDPEKLMSCCRHKSAGGASLGEASTSSGSSCAGCSGGNCSTCH